MILKQKYIILLGIICLTIGISSSNKDNAAEKFLASNSVKNDRDTLAVVRPFEINSDLPAEEKLEIKKSLEYYYRTKWVRNNLNGSFLVAKNGEIIYENWRGLADRKKKTPLTQNTPLHIASVSKVLTATAVLKLVESQKIDLDQKVSSILPSFPYKKISVRMLLNHRSGLPKYSHFTERPGVWNRKKILTNNDILALLNKHKFSLYFSPNTRFAYCNTNYAILALIVEKVTGLNFRTAMSEMIFKPLGMKNTYVFDYHKHKDTCSQSYIRRRHYQFNYLDDVYGDKNVYSTARDLLKFDIATYSPDFLSGSLRNQVYKGYSFEKRGAKNYGLGIRLEELHTGKTMHYHNGWWHGNTSCYTTMKKDTISIIALSNHYTKLVYGAKKLHNLFDDYTYRTAMQ